MLDRTMTVRGWASWLRSAMPARLNVGLGVSELIAKLIATDRTAVIPAPTSAAVPAVTPAATRAWAIATPMTGGIRQILHAATAALNGRDRNPLRPGETTPRPQRTPRQR